MILPAAGKDRWEPEHEARTGPTRGQNTQTTPENPRCSMTAIYIYTADGAFPNPRLTSPTSSVAAARPAPFSSGLLLFALSWIRAAALVLFSFLISPLDSAPHLAFTLILFLGDLEGIRWEQVMRTRQGHQNPLLGMID